jgi:cell division protein FtsB
MAIETNNVKTRKPTKKELEHSIGVIMDSNQKLIAEIEQLKLENRDLRGELNDLKYPEYIPPTPKKHWWNRG